MHVRWAVTQTHKGSLLCLQSKRRVGKLRMQEANTDSKFRKGQKDADFFKKLHKVCCHCDQLL